MSVFEIQERCDLLIGRYKKFDATGGTEASSTPLLEQEFEEVYDQLKERVDELRKKADELAASRFAGRDQAAQMVVENAQLRRGKKQVQEMQLQLQVLISKGKRVTRDVVVERTQKADELQHMIAGVPDEVRHRQKIFHTKKAAPSGLGNQSAVYVGEVTSDHSGVDDKAIKYRNAWEMAKRRQNETLDVIAIGLDKLQDQGLTVLEELDRQDAFLKGVEDRVDVVQTNLGDNTSKITTTSKVTPGIRFCVASVLVFILLACLGFILTQLDV
mmetsp:Transcript_38264/g.96923  ORF Transcript_38264/g.96923 Transcript_38264/m.96923 type:complete len:272 (-) Transcript_38264:117-932(-)|eukprot:jgi/Tetstr1/445960/TSEL_033587.t1